MATHTRYCDIKKWTEATGRRSIQLWMPKATVRVLDRLCRQRGVGRAELLDSLISEVGGREVTGRYLGIAIGGRRSANGSRWSGTVYCTAQTRVWSRRWPFSSAVGQKLMVEDPLQPPGRS